MRLIVARHAETVFNAGARMQGQMAHTPLTRTGIAQAEAMGVALAAAIGRDEDIDLWASPAGRTLQTAAIIVEHLGRDYFDIRTDPRLLEIDVGEWEGRLYAEIVAEQGPIVCPEQRLFTTTPPGGETYAEVAARLKGWIADLEPDREVLLISHGMTLRVLRGLLAGGGTFGDVIVGPDAPQGTIFLIQNSMQRELHRGTGQSVPGGTA